MRKPPQNATSLLPGYAQFADDQEALLCKREQIIRQIWKEGLSGDRLYTARSLIYCGLPVSKSEKSQIVRKAQLGKEEFARITYVRTHPHVPLPFGADRTMMYFLTNKAVLQQSSLLQWNTVSEYMHLFGINPDGGKNHRRAQEQFVRLAYMDMIFEFLDSKGHTVQVWKCPFIEHARLDVEVKKDGEWGISKSIAKMLATDQTVEFGWNFYHHLLKVPVPIPLDLIRVARTKWAVMDFMLFIYWRCWAAHTESLIPWEHLKMQFDDLDSNPWRFTQNFKKAIYLLRSLPDPINQIRAEAETAGLRIIPLPVGTTIFEGHPKLGMQNIKFKE